MDAGGEKLYRSCARGGTPWKRSGSCEPCLPASGPRPSRRRRREVRLLCWVDHLGVVGELAEPGGTTELEGVAVFSTAGSAAAWESEEDGSDGAGQLGRALGVGFSQRREGGGPVGLGLRRGRNFLHLKIFGGKSCLWPSDTDSTSQNRVGRDTPGPAFRMGQFCWQKGMRQSISIYLI